MEDFYKLLNIDPSLSIEEINKELMKMETTWIKRENNGNEKAAEKLVLIKKAKEVFKNKGSRIEYDAKLKSGASSGNSSEEDDKLNEALEWKNKAVAFFQEGQVDLATGAIEKAMQFIATWNDDHDIYIAAAIIYRTQKRYQESVKAANNLILIKPYSPEGYYHKFLTYYNIYLSSNNKDEIIRSINEFKNLYPIIIEKAKQVENTEIECNVKGLMSGYAFDFEHDIKNAEIFAKEACELGEHETAKAVLNAINDMRNRSNFWKNEEETFNTRFAAAKKIVLERREKRAALEKKNRVFRVLSWIALIGLGALMVVSAESFVMFAIIVGLLAIILSYFSGACSNEDSIIDILKPILIVMLVISIAGGIVISFKTQNSVIISMLKFIVGSTVSEALMCVAGKNAKNYINR